MFTRATEDNRIDEQPIITRFERTYTAGSVSAGSAYYAYTRIRTGTWKHIGMTKAGAIDAAQKYNILLNRLVPNEWRDGSTGWMPVIPSRTQKDHYWKYQQCGIATVQHEGNGRYSVVVNLDEQLYTRYNPTAGYPWSSFESNPDIVTDKFCEWETGNDCRYYITYQSQQQGA